MILEILECYFFDYILGLNMIIVPVIWASFDFRPCKKKFEIHPCKKKIV